MNMLDLSTLPADLQYMSAELRKQVKVAAFLSSSTELATPGGTVICGGPDRPMDTGIRSGRFDCSPEDGESSWLQLNLAEVPAEVSAAGQIPKHGVLWVHLDLSDRWKAPVYFDPRDAALIPWQPRDVMERATGVEWILAPTLPSSDGIADLLWHDPVAADLYDDWLHNHVRAPSEIQIGGHQRSIYGSHEEDSRTLFVSMTGQSWGDNGGLFLRYRADAATWTASAETH